MQYTIKISTFSTGDSSWYVLRENGTHVGWGWVHTSSRSASVAKHNAERFIRELRLYEPN